MREKVYKYDAYNFCSFGIEDDNDTGCSQVDALQKRLDIALDAIREAIATNELPRHIEDDMTDILTELEADDE